MLFFNYLANNKEQFCFVRVFFFIIVLCFGRTMKEEKKKRNTFIFKKAAL